MLTLELLRANQYRQVAEWEHGPQEDVDWARYDAEMNQPQWLHFGIYMSAEFIGCVSFEKIDAETVEYHVVTARHKIHPQSLAQLLLNTATFLFSHGFKLLRVRIPASNRAAARLAIRCGMTETIRDETSREFILTRPLITPSRPEHQNGNHEAEARSRAL